MRFPTRMIFWILVSVLAVAVIFAILRGYFSDVVRMLAEKLEVAFD